MLVEVPRQRTLVSKTFVGGPASGRVAEIHCGPVHFDNWLGLDGERGLRSLSWDLVDGGAGEWGFERNMFHPAVPKFADGWLGFRDVFDRKDQTIRLRCAGVGHVPGRLVQEIKGVSAGANAIVYPDAYATGIDLIVCFSRTRCRKLIRFRAGHYPTVDMALEFELELPAGAEVFRDGARVDLAADNIFAKPVPTLIGSGKYTRFEPFKIWDSGEPGRRHEATVTVEYKYSAGVMKLRKLIPAIFFLGAHGDVFTDATWTGYSGSGDGYTSGYDGPAGSWDTAHDLATANDSANDGANTVQVGSYEAGWAADLFGHLRAFVPFDSSGLPSGLNISAITLAMWADSKTNDDADGNDFIRLVETSQNSTGAVITADHNQCGAVDNPTAGAPDVDIDNINTGSRAVIFTLNATGRGWIDEAGWTKLGLREGHDAVDDQIADNTSCLVVFHSSDYTGSDRDPLLSVTYTVPGNPWYAYAQM